ncbi:MAG TPA: hypothetical protein VEY51_20135, partial [Chondromyces sp.]|nr:hypothetical protein [Chondromyces sp.]
LSEEHAIKAEEQLQYLVFPSLRIEFIFAHTGYNGLLQKETRKINGKKYDWQIYNPNTSKVVLSQADIAESLCAFIINKEKSTLNFFFKRDFEDRLNRCETVKEKMLLIEEELNHLEETKNSYKNIYDEKPGKLWYAGYKAESRKQGILSQKILAPEVYYILALGASMYQKKCWLKDLLEDLSISNQEKFEDDGDPPTVVSINSIAHKVLLLHELGIIEHLEKKYPDRNQNQIADIATAILGIEDPAKAGTVRKAIGNIQLPRGHEKGIKTDAAIKKLEAALEKLKITPTKL